MSKPTFSRVRSMRKRTWLVSGVLVVSLAFYVLVSVNVGKEINILDFLVLATMQVIVHGVYFPDGALFGEKDATFTTNKNAYNDKAYRVNEEACFGELREYCKIEWERRKHEYVISELNAIGITEKEFCEIKKLSAAEIKKLKEFETQGKKFFLAVTSENALSALYSRLYPLSQTTRPLLWAQLPRTTGSLFTIPQNAITRSNTLSA